MTKPEITYDVRSEMWEVTDNWCYRRSSGPKILIYIDKGYRTDLASIPRIFWRLIAPFELSIAAPLVHDYLYGSGGVAAYGRFTRRETDDLFLQIMTDEGVPWWRRKAAYRAVRMFAWFAWREK